MSDQLRVLAPAALQQAARVPDSAVAERWQAAMSNSAGTNIALLSLLDDWAEFAEVGYEEMLRTISEAQTRIDDEWIDQDPGDPEEAARFYDRTETLIPLLLWWHGTDLNPARCATHAAAAMGAVGGRRALDFGCGIGSTALLLAEAGAEVLLADVAEGPLRFAEWRLRKRHHEVESLHLLDGSLEEIKPGSMDLVTSFDVFEHLPDPTQSLAGLDRVLAPAGLICFNQAYVPAQDELQHFPQRGEVLRWLHERGYRLAHLPSVCWIAQKAPLGRVAHEVQGLALGMRIAATRAIERGNGRLAERFGPRVIRQALR